MKKWAVGLLAMLVVLSGTAVPSDAWVRGGGFHHGFHGGCCWGGWWWPGAFVGGVALGTVASTYPYPYYYVPYAPSTVVYPQAPTYAAPPAPPIQREVVYPNGRYVLYGDGVTQAWQWVWVPAAPPPPPPPQR